MNKWLIGNGLWCAACEGTGLGRLSDTIIYDGGVACDFYHPCEVCKGQKRLAAELPDVIADAVPRTEPKFHTCMSQCIKYRRVRPSDRV